MEGQHDGVPSRTSSAPDWAGFSAGLGDDERAEALTGALLLLVPPSAHVPTFKAREAGAQIVRASASETTDLLSGVRDAFDTWGFRAILGESTLRELGADAARTRVMILHEDRARWSVVTPHSTRRFEVAHGDDLSSRDTLSLNAMAAQLGVDPNASVRWLAVDEAPAAQPAGPHDAVVEAAHGHAPHRSPFAQVRRLLAGERRDLVVVMLYALGVGLMALVTPVAVQALVNTVAFGSLLQPVIVLTLAVLFGLGFAGAMRAMQALVVEVLQQRLFARLATDFAWRIPRAHPEAFTHAHGPEQVNRFFDVMTVQKSLASLLLDGITVVLTTVVGLIVMSFYHPALFAFAACLVIAVLFVVFGLGWGGVRTAVKESKAKYAVAAWLQEIARNPVAFKSAGGVRMAQERADDLATAYVTARKKHFRVVFRQVLGALVLQTVMSAALLGLGGYLVISRSLTLGQLIAAELIVTAVVDGVTKLGKHIESYYDLAAAADKLGHLLDLPLEPEASTVRDMPAGPADLRADHVSLGAHHGGNAVVQGVSFHVRPGERVAWLHTHEEANARMAGALYGLDVPEHGSIALDGTDLREIRRVALRREVALVRDDEIFEGTLLENVQVGREHVRVEDVRAVLRELGLDAWVSTLPDALLTRVTTGAPDLPRGVVARLMLARAMVGRPRLIVVDGLLDRTEPEARDAALHALNSRALGSTVIVATQRREVASRLPRTIDLSASHIEKDGAHG